MPTLAELANEVNNALSQIEAHTKDTANALALIKGDTADLAGRVDVINATLDDGFAFLGQGMFALLEAQRVTNATLATTVEQLEVMLSWLAKLVDMMGKRLRTLEPELATQPEITTNDPRGQGWDGQWKRKPQPKG